MNTDGLLIYLCATVDILFLSWDDAEAGAALEVAFGEESLLRSAEAFPTDVPGLVSWADESVVVVHLAVAFAAANRGLVCDFGVS